MYDLEDKVGCWHTEMIYLAIQKGYIIEDIYEVWHFDETQRTNTAMRGYMEFFLRRKQEAEGWNKLGGKKYKHWFGDGMTLTEDQKDEICEYTYQMNGGFARPNKRKVAVNPVQRQIAKIFLNCLWGKLVQKPPEEHDTFLNGYKQYMEFMSNSLVDHLTTRFRFINHSDMKVRYHLHEELVAPVESKWLNIYMGASVTGHAQVLLMNQMYVVGTENMIYCDTDSIFAKVKRTMRDLCRPGLGGWADELAGNQYIWAFYGMAPKSYYTKIVTMNNGEMEIESEVKVKGVRKNIQNEEILNEENIHRLVEDAFMGTTHDKLKVNHMIIHPNSTNRELVYGSIYTDIIQKNVNTVYSKRDLVKNDDPNVLKLSDMSMVRLLPRGYEGEWKHEKVTIIENPVFI